MRRVQSVQRVTLRKILTQPVVGGFCFAQHRGIGIEEYVDGNERFPLAFISSSFAFESIRRHNTSVKNKVKNAFSHHQGERLRHYP